jgi:hypothetical protein
MTHGTRSRALCGADCVVVRLDLKVGPELREMEITNKALPTRKLDSLWFASELYSERAKEDCSARLSPGPIPNAVDHIFLGLNFSH